MQAHADYQQVLKSMQEQNQKIKQIMGMLAIEDVKQVFKEIRAEMQNIETNTD
jgi:hypothetical protein